MKKLLDEANNIYQKSLLSNEEQLKYLKKHNYKTLTMKEFYEWSLSRSSR